MCCVRVSLMKEIAYPGNPINLWYNLGHSDNQLGSAAPLNCLTSQTQLKPRCTFDQARLALP